MRFKKAKSVKVVFYRKQSGREPAKDAVLNLPADEKANALERLSGIQQHGFDFTRVEFKPVKGKLWEIKYRYKNQHRFLYCIHNVDTLVILHYVKKKTQKLEQKDKDIAEKRMMEVLNNG